MSAKLGTLTLDLVARTSSFTQGMSQASRTTTQEMARIEASVATAMNSIKALGAAFGASFTVSSISNLSDSYKSIKDQLKLVTKSQDQLNTAMKDTHLIAQSTASDWDSVVSVYTKFQKISERLGISQADVASITDTVTKAVGMSGASADESQRSLVQFSQALSLGVLKGQDLNSVMQQTPGLTDAIAEGMGTTSDKLKQMGTDGVLTTEIVVKALQNVAKSVDEKFAETATLNAATWSLIKNEAIKSVGEIDQALGTSRAFVDGMTAFSKNLDVAAVGVVTLAAAYTASLIPAVVASGKAFLISSVEAARYQLTLAAMAAQATATSVTMTVLGGAARAALTVMLGPVGLILTAASVATGYMLMRDSTQKATEKLIEQAKVADKTREELLKLQGVQKASAIDDATAAFEAQNKELRKSELAMGSRLIAIQNMMKGDAQVADISNKARLGTISYKEAIEQLNKLPVSTELFKALEKEYIQYDKNRAEAQKLADTQGILGKVAKLLGNETENAARKQDSLNSSMRDGELAANAAAGAYDEYMKKLQQSAKEAQWIASYASRNNIPTNEAKAVYDAAVANGGTIGREGVDAVLKYTREANAVRDLDNARAEASRKAASYSRSAESEAKKRESELKRQRELTQRLAEDQLRQRKSLTYEFGTDEQKMLNDYNSKVADIESSGFSDSAKKWYLDEAKSRFDAQKEYYLAQLAFETTEHKLNETQKLNFEHQLRLRGINARNDLENDAKTKVFKAEQERHKTAIAWHKLEEEMLINDAQSRFLTDLQLIESKYEFERQQIALTHSNDPVMRDMLINASYRTQDLDNDENRRTVWMDYQSATGVDTSADEERSRREESIQAAWEWQLITQEEYQQKLLESEQQYMAAKADLQLGGWQQIASGTASIMGDMFGEQSKAHQIMFAIDKGFAIAQSALAIQQSIAKAMSLGFPKNIPVIGQAVMQGAQIAANIKAIAMPVGMAHNGIDNIPKEGTWLLDGGERVLNPQQNKDLTNYLSNSKGGGEPIVNVYTLPGQTAEVSHNERGELVVLIKEVINQEVPAQIGDPSSRISSSISQGYGLQRSRP